ncbi:hypothetical protein ACOMHN_008710 [Nucella lapillus]
MVLVSGSRSSRVCDRGVCYGRFSSHRLSTEENGTRTGLGGQELSGLDLADVMAARADSTHDLQSDFRFSEFPKEAAGEEGSPVRNGGCLFGNDQGLCGYDASCRTKGRTTWSSIHYNHTQVLLAPGTVSVLKSPQLDVTSPSCMSFYVSVNFPAHMDVLFGNSEGFCALGSRISPANVTRWFHWDIPRGRGKVMFRAFSPASTSSTSSVFVRIRSVSLHPGCCRPLTAKSLSNHSQLISPVLQPPHPGSPPACLTFNFSLPPREEGESSLQVALVKLESKDQLALWEVSSESSALESTFAVGQMPVKGFAIPFRVQFLACSNSGHPIALKDVQYLHLQTGQLCPVAPSNAHFHDENRPSSSDYTEIDDILLIHSTPRQSQVRGDVINKNYVTEGDYHSITGESVTGKSREETVDDYHHICLAAGRDKGADSTSRFGHVQQDDYSHTATHRVDTCSHTGAQNTPDRSDTYSHIGAQNRPDITLDNDHRVGAGNPSPHKTQASDDYSHIHTRSPEGCKRQNPDSFHHAPKQNVGAARMQAGASDQTRNKSHTLPHSGVTNNGNSSVEEGNQHGSVPEENIYHELEASQCTGEGADCGMDSDLSPVKPTTHVAGESIPEDNYDHLGLVKRNNSLGVRVDVPQVYSHVHGESNYDVVQRHKPRYPVDSNYQRIKYASKE